MKSYYSQKSLKKLVILQIQYFTQKAQILQIMDFEDRRKEKTQNTFNIQFQDNAYQEIFSQTGGSKSYESKSMFDEYSSSQYTDFSKTDHFFRDDQQESKDPNKNQNNYQSRSSFYTQNQITSPEKQNELKYTKNSPQSTNKSDNQSHEQNQNPYLIKAAINLTSRDILNLQIRRQQEIKTLSEEDFIRSKEFQFFETEKDVNWKLSIADYYEKVIPDPEFNKWIKKTRRNSQYRDIAFWVIIPGLIYFQYAAKTNYLPKFFSNNAKLIRLIPIAGIYFIGHFQIKKEENAKEFFKQAQNQQIIRSLIRRYLCDASAKQRLDVYQAK